MKKCAVQLIRAFHGADSEKIELTAQVEDTRRDRGQYRKFERIIKEYTE